MTQFMKAFEDAAKSDPEFKELFEEAKHLHKEKSIAEKEAREKAARAAELEKENLKARERQAKIEKNLQKTLWYWYVCPEPYSVVSGIAFYDTKEGLEKKLMEKYSKSSLYNPKHFRMTVEPVDLSEEITEISCYFE